MDLKQINDLTISAYNALAEKYHESFKDEMSHKLYDQQVLDQFSKIIGSNKSICDAGCGPSGHIGAYLQQYGHAVTGIDISPDCIELASMYQPDMKFLVMDMMDTNFKAEVFDAIISYYSIIHTPKTKIPDIIKEYHRILKPNGLLLIVVKKGKQEGIISEEWFEEHPVYFTQFLEHELEDYLTNNSFTVKEIHTRTPSELEIGVERIYITGVKV